MPVFVPFQGCVRCKPKHQRSNDKVPVRFVLFYQVSNHLAWTLDLVQFSQAKFPLVVVLLVLHLPLLRLRFYFDCTGRAASVHLKQVTTCKLQVLCFCIIDTRVQRRLIVNSPTSNARGENWCWKKTQWNCGRLPTPLFSKSSNGSYYNYN